MAVQTALVGDVGAIGEVVHHGRAGLKADKRPGAAGDQDRIPIQRRGQEGGGGVVLTDVDEIETAQVMLGVELRRGGAQYGSRHAQLRHQAAGNVVGREDGLDPLLRGEVQKLRLGGNGVFDADASRDVVAQQVGQHQQPVRVFQQEVLAVQIHGGELHQGVEGRDLVARMHVDLAHGHDPEDGVPVLLRARIAIGADRDQHLAVCVDQRKIIVVAVHAQGIHLPAGLRAAKAGDQLAEDAQKIPVHAVPQADHSVWKAVNRRDLQGIAAQLAFKQLAAAGTKVKCHIFHAGKPPVKN